MDNKTNLKIKKYNMIMWSFLGTVSFIILILTVLSLAGVLDVLFNPVLGILMQPDKVIFYGDNVFLRESTGWR